MRFLIHVSVFILLATYAVADENPAKLRRNAGLISFGEYDPAAPTGWASIPEPAKSRIIAHLKDRLGDAFYAKLSLAGGQIVDIKTLHEKHPLSKEYQWEVPAYRLILSFSLPGDGIESFEASIECRADGSVIQEIDLPEIAKHPERAKFISTAKASEIAKEKGFDAAKAEMEMNYRKELDVIVYTFTQMTRHEGVRLYYKCIDIDAHSGKVIKIYDSEAIE